MKCLTDPIMSLGFGEAFSTYDRPLLSIFGVRVTLREYFNMVSNKTGKLTDIYKYIHQRSYCFRE